MKSKRIIVTGVNGQVGHALQSMLKDYEVFGLSRAELDLTDEHAIRRVIDMIKPDLIISSAAYTAVDNAESEPELAYKINTDAPRLMAESAEKIGAALIHISTDYVYDGSKKEPYIESDLTNPVSVYGKTKLGGELGIASVGLPHLILRTSWIYSNYGNNFLKTILRLAAERDSLRIVSDQYGAPTSNIVLAQAITGLVEKWNPSNFNESGVYHTTCSGKTSWHGFASEIIKQYKDLEIKPELKVTYQELHQTPSSEYATAAARPLNSCLNNEKLNQTFGLSLPHWQDALTEVMKSL
jgi:dTDP-4-dehydrorhamnose reductase